MQPVLSFDTFKVGNVAQDDDHDTNDDDSDKNVTWQLHVLQLSRMVSRSL